MAADGKSLNVVDHYSSLGRSFIDEDRRHDEMVKDHMIVLLKYFDCKADDQIVEVGAGSCICSRELLELVPLKKPIICIDKFEEMIKNACGIPNIQTKVMDAVEFSRLDIRYDKIFCRAFLHHLDKKDIKELFSNIFQQLNENGIFVNISMDNCNNRPWFKKLKDVFPRTHIEADYFVKELTLSGFSNVDSYICKNTVKVTKDSLFRSFRERYVSIMQFLTDQDIEEGIEEVDKMFPNQDTIEFEDEYFFIVAKK